MLGNPAAVPSNKHNMENVQNETATLTEVAIPKYRVITGIVDLTVVASNETENGDFSTKFVTEMLGEEVAGMEMLGAIGARKKHFYLFSKKQVKEGTVVPCNMELFVVNRTIQEWTTADGEDREDTIDRLEIRRNHISGL